MNGNDKQSAQPATETIAAQEAVNYAKLYGMACEAIDSAGFTITTDADKGIMNLRHKNASPVAFVGSDGRPAWIHDGIGIGKTTATQVGTYLYAIPVTAAPVGFDCTHSTEDNYQHFLAYSGLEGSDVLRYAYFHGADVGIDRPRMQATPAAQGIDLRNAILQLQEDALHMKDPGDTVNAYNRVLALIDASPKGAVHPDDLAVDAFAAAMKAKLAEARAKGRGGWQGDEPGMQQRLSNMLRDHIEKGDPRDVANFCMFLHQRGEGISPNGGSADESIDLLSELRDVEDYFTNVDPNPIHLATVRQTISVIAGCPKGGINSRATFEAWAAGKILPLHRMQIHIGIMGDYSDAWTHCAWTAWQAAMQATSAEVGA